MTGQFLRFDPFPLGQQSTYSGRTDPLSVCFARGDPHYLHPAGDSRFAVATVMPETVVVSGNERFRADTSEQNPLDELRTGQGTECAVERNDDHNIDARLLQQSRLFIERSQQPQIIGPAERYSRMRVECQDDAFSAECTGFCAQTFQQRPMSPMHAVESPHRDGRMPEMRQSIEPPKNPHGQLLLSFSLTK